LDAVKLAASIADDVRPATTKRCRSRQSSTLARRAGSGVEFELETSPTCRPRKRR